MLLKCKLNINGIILLLHAKIVVEIKIEMWIYVCLNSNDCIAKTDPDTQEAFEAANPNSPATRKQGDQTELIHHPTGHASQQS